MCRPRNWMLPVTLAATFMYGFDLNVVNVALPTLQRDLAAGPAALQLIVGGYAFTYAAGLVTGGRLGDILGYRRMFAIGMAAFTLASLMCGLAQNSGELVAARLLQGLTAALMVPQVLALITTSLPPEARPRALAWFGVTAGVSGLCGQVVGGLLLTADLFGWSWRVIFFLNVPIGVVVLTFVRRAVPRVATSTRSRLDLLGVVTVSIALGLALVPLILGRQLGWPVWIWCSLAASVPAMAVTLVWERRLQRTGGQPLLDLTLFRIASFTTGLVVSVAFMAAFTSSVFVVSLLLQDGLHLDALHAGLCFLPMALAGVGAPLIGRRLVPRLGPHTVMRIGASINVVSLVVLAVALEGSGGADVVVWIVVTAALLGVGNMLIFPTLIGTALAGVRPDQAGGASGALNTTQQFAGALGVAALGTLLFAVLSGHSDRAAYAHATAATLWVITALNLAIVALNVALTARRTTATATA